MGGLMLTQTEVEAILQARIKVAGESCNGHHRNRVFGQITALIFVLTGEVIHVNEGTNIREILRLCQTPYKDSEDGGIELSDEWMAAHELTDDFHHARLSTRW